MSDETTDLSSSESESEQAEDSQLKTGADAETSDTGEGKSEDGAKVPSYRLREETAKRKEAEKVANWYRENVGDPDDVIAFRKWKEGQKAESATTGDNEELTPAQINSVKALIVKAMPELKDIDLASLRELVRTQKEAQQVTVMVAQEELGNLISEAGYDDKDAERIEWLVGAEIGRDPVLDKLWKAGNIQALHKAFDRVKSFYRNGANPKANPDLARTKRSVTKLPVASGGAGTVSTSSPGKRLKGLDGDAGKQASDQAWEMLNQSS